MRRERARYRLRIAKSVAAPASYVYDWCTDFRADDGRFSSSRPRFRVVRYGADRVVRVRETMTSSGRSLAVEMIRLEPPHRWHVDQIDEDDHASVDYEVRPLTAARTEIVLRIAERWFVDDYPRREEYRRRASGYWDTLVSGLLSDYRQGRPARAGPARSATTRRRSARSSG